MKTFHYIIFSGLLLYGASCSPVVYSTVGHNVPLLQNKGEISLNGNVASTENGDGGSLQVAAAANDHVAFMMSFYSLKNETSEEWQGKGSYFEFGAGSFGYLDPKNKTFIAEVFLGAGSGGIKNLDQNSSSLLNVSFFKPFIQPSIGISGKWYDVALTPRFALVTYTSHTVGVDDPQLRADAERYFDDKKSTFVFEPGLTLRLGYKSVRGQFQYGISTFSYDENSDVNINNQFLSLGVHWLISKRWIAEDTD